MRLDLSFFCTFLILSILNLFPVLSDQNTAQYFVGGVHLVTQVHPRDNCWQLDRKMTRTLPLSHFSTHSSQQRMTMQRKMSWFCFYLVGVLICSVSGWSFLCLSCCSCTPVTTLISRVLKHQFSSLLFVLPGLALVLVLRLCSVGRPRIWNQCFEALSTEPCLNSNWNPGTTLPHLPPTFCPITQPAQIITRNWFIQAKNCCNWVLHRINPVRSYNLSTNVFRGPVKKLKQQKIAYCLDQER